MAKNSLVALCSQYPAYRCTGSDYRLQVMLVPLPKVPLLWCKTVWSNEEEEEKKKLVQNGILG